MYHYSDGGNINADNPIKFYREMNQRKWLDEQLSRALSVKLNDGILSIIDEFKYVLTLDYTIKLLNIHERVQCGSPVIIEGETGVGKTALVEILSKLWNQSLVLEWSREHKRLQDFISSKARDVSSDYRRVVSVRCTCLYIYSD